MNRYAVMATLAKQREFFDLWERLFLIFCVSLLERNIGLATSPSSLLYRSSSTSSPSFFQQLTEIEIPEWNQPYYEWPYSRGGEELLTDATISGFYCGIYFLFDDDALDVVEKKEQIKVWIYSHTIFYCRERATLLFHGCSQTGNK